MRKSAGCSALFALGLLASVPAQSVAKPPDLPVQMEVQCTPTAQGCTDKVCGGSVGCPGMNGCSAYLYTSHSPCCPGCSAFHCLWQALCQTLTGCGDNVEAAIPVGPPQPFGFGPCPVPGPVGWVAGPPMMPPSMMPCAAPMPPGPPGMIVVPAAHAFGPPCPLFALPPVPPPMPAPMGMPLPQRMYMLAEYYDRLGHREAAHACLNMAHMHDPASPLGQKASACLAEMDGTGTSAEMPVMAEEQEARPALPRRVRPITSGEQYLLKLTQAQEMFHIAERCRRNGDLDMAYSCYHEARRICPNSEYAQRADKFIRRIEAVRELAEEAEPVEDVSSEESCNQPVPFYCPILFPLSSGLPMRSQEESARAVIVIEEGNSEMEAADKPVCNRPCQPAASRDSCSGADAAITEIIRKLAEQYGPQEAEDCEGEDDNTAEPAEEGTDPDEVSAAQPWYQPMLQTLQGQTRTNLDIDLTRSGCMRIQCNVYVGTVGVQVRYADGHCTVVCPLLPLVR